MKHYHKKRLLTLCDFLEQLPKKHFDFGVVANRQLCGTVGCAMGWTPKALPHLVKWLFNSGNIRIALRGEKYEQSYTIVAQSLFGLAFDDAHSLFTPGADAQVGSTILYSLPVSATPKQVAKRLREFLKLVEKDS